MRTLWISFLSLLALHGMAVAQQASMYRPTRSLSELDPSAPILPMKDAPPAKTRFPRLLYAAKEDMRQGRWTDAEAKLTRIIKDEPGGQHTRFLLGTMYLQDFRYAEGIRWLEPLLEERPGDPVVRNNLAWGYAKVRNPAVRNFDKALRLAKDAVDIGRDRLVYLDTVAEIYATALTDPEGRRSLGNVSWSLDDRRAIAGIFLTTGRYGEALTLLEPMLKETPDNPALKNNLAWCLLNVRDPRKRDPRRALIYAQEAILDMYNDYNTWNSLAEAYSANGDYERALAIATQVKRTVTLFDVKDAEHHVKFYEYCDSVNEAMSIIE